MRRSKEDKMKKLYFFLLLLFTFTVTDALAGDLKEIQLNDGSLIYCEVISLSDGVYAMKSPVLGSLKIDESNINSITSIQSTREEIQALKSEMLSNDELLDIILALRNDPDFQAALEDPKVLEAVNSGDINALLANQNFVKLLNNPRILTIRDKMQK
jgi:hypothetical protein